jgi:hypothetical protein
MDGTYVRRKNLAHSFGLPLLDALCMLHQTYNFLGKRKEFSSFILLALACLTPF